MIAVHNLKGGVTKTSSTLELGFEAAQQGLRVLLVDTDMQGNLTTKFMHTMTPAAGDADSVAVAEGGGEKEDSEAEDKVEEDEREYYVRYDKVFKDAGVEESVKGTQKPLRAFHHILETFTGAHVQFARSQLKRIEPLRPKPTIAEGVTLDLIAGHLLTSEFDYRISEGLKSDGQLTASAAMPGLVTNVIREFADRPEKKYDLVLFDCGPHLSPVTIAVLLGVDYIIAPFRPERDCVTAALIMPRRVRDWHSKARQAGWLHATVIKEKMIEERAGLDEDTKATYVDPTLRCFPLYLGAFACAVKTKERCPTEGDQMLMNRVYDTYAKELPQMMDTLVAGQHHLRPACWGDTMNKKKSPTGGTAKWTKFNGPQNSLASHFVSNSMRLYQTASNLRSRLPCMGA